MLLCKYNLLSFTMASLPSLRFFYVLLTLPFTIAFDAIIFFVNGSKYKKFKNDVSLYVKYKSLLRLVSIPREDARFVNGKSIDDVFREFKKSHRTITQSLLGFGETYDDRSAWVVKSPERRLSDPILIFLHGGSYSLQLSVAHLETLVAIFELLDPNKKKNLSILVLGYRLTSFGETFPAQKQDLDATYQKLTAREKNTNITFLGDSSGAHLALVYLQFLKKLSKDRNSDLIYPRNLILSSPWLNVNPEPDQYVRGNSWWEYSKTDIVSFESFSDPKFLKFTFGDSDLGSPDVSPLSFPFNIHDWEDIPTINGNVLVLVGEIESFRDDILEWSNFVYGCPFHLDSFTSEYEKSKGVFDTSIHQFQRRTEMGEVGFRLFVDPGGFHDYAFLFENTLLSKIKKEKTMNSGNIDSEKYFCIHKMVRFLNDVL